MSAIGGIFALLKPQNPINEYLYSILDKLSHRGTESEGYTFFQGETTSCHYGVTTKQKDIQRNNLKSKSEAPGETWMGLGHKSGGVNSNNGYCHQPLQIQNGNYWIVFDGEILNFKEIAKQLRDEGIEAPSEDHAQTLLLAYSLWKEKVLNKIEGSFSFVIYDSIEKKLFGARDPFGIRPFYYVQSDLYFAFGSELKSLISLPFVSKKISKSAVYDYLILGQSETSNQSMFRGLTELLPGTAFSILVPKGSMKIWSYFQITPDSKLDRYSRNKVSTLAHRLRKSLISNTNQHLSPGLKTSYNLSPNLENLTFPFLIKESIHEIKSNDKPKISEIISGIFSEVLHEDEEAEKTFFATDKIAKELQIEMIRSVCNFDDFHDNIKKVCYLQDLPFSNLDVFAQFKMLKVAKENGIQVLIENTGGEQLFSTSNNHFQQFSEDLLGRKEYRLFLDNLFNAKNTNLSKWGLVQKLGKQWLFKKTANDLKETLIKTSQDEFQYIKGDFIDRYSKNLENNIDSIPTSLNQLLVREIAGPLVKEKLRTSDRNAQYHQIEVRHPFVSDRELSESMLKSSSVYKIRSGVAGNLLRKAMRGVFPDQIMNSHYGSPKRREINWLMDSKEDLKEYLTTDLDDFIDSKKIKRDWDRLVLLSNSQQNDFLWRVVSLAIWRSSFFNT
jgi:asparagine synthase (glutamine-hydrolysing)